MPLDEEARRREVESKKRLDQATGGHSDHLMLVRLFNEWNGLSTGDQFRYAADNNVNPYTLRMIRETRTQLTKELTTRGLLSNLAKHSGSATNCNIVRSALVRAAPHAIPQAAPACKWHWLHEHGSG